MGAYTKCSATQFNGFSNAHDVIYICSEPGAKALLGLWCPQGQTSCYAWIDSETRFFRILSGESFCAYVFKIHDDLCVQVDLVTDKEKERKADELNRFVHQYQDNFRLKTLGLVNPLFCNTCKYSMYDAKSAFSTNRIVKKSSQMHFFICETNTIHTCDPRECQNRLAPFR
jgi:hypothetical protein